MLAVLGLVTIALLLTVIMTKWMSPLMALIAVPTAASLLGGFGLRPGSSSSSGIREVAPVAGMFVFAILYFGIMADAGMLDPIIDRILRPPAAGRPRIVPGTALLALLVHLDGSGAVTSWSRFRRCCRCTSGWEWTGASSRRRLAGRGRELPALDGAHDPGLGRPCASPRPRSSVR